jgi:hypothetical protein
VVLVIEIALELLLRLCPFCGNRTIIGHGRRFRQAHDEHHDHIWVVSAAITQHRRQAPPACVD